jgi:SOS-response transcriptional repressor LexA
VLRAVVEHISEDGVSPTFVQIMARTGIRSTNGVMVLLTALQREGFITREPGCPRCLRAGIFVTTTGRRALASWVVRQ